MMNPFAVAMSEDILQQQKNILLERLSYISSISDAPFKADYMRNVDAVAHGHDGKNYNVQFKHREEGHNDFFLIADKLTGRAIKDKPIGFTYGGNRYTFNLGDADIFIETLGNGSTHILTREEINSLEFDSSLNLSSAIKGIQPKYVEKDDGSSFFTGHYYVFIDSYKLPQLKNNILTKTFAQSSQK